MVGLRFWDTRHRVLRSPTMGNFVFLKTAPRLKWNRKGYIVSIVNDSSSETMHGWIQCMDEYNICFSEKKNKLCSLNDLPPSGCGPCIRTWGMLRGRGWGSHRWWRTPRTPSRWRWSCRWPLRTFRVFEVIEGLGREVNTLLLVLRIVKSYWGSLRATRRDPRRQMRVATPSMIAPCRTGTVKSAEHTCVKHWNTIAIKLKCFFH